MNILLIGGSGFLGSHIVRKLIDRNHDLTIIARNPDNEMPFDKSKVKLIKGDILQVNNLDIKDKFDVLVYTAMVPFKPGRVSTKKFKELEIKTKQYYQNTINLARKLSCSLILTSGASFDTQGDEVADESWPISRKGMAGVGISYDTMIEEIRIDNSIPLIEMLPGQIYGNGGMFARMIDMAKSGKVVIFGNGKNCLPRIHVEDCAEAYVMAIEKLPVGKRFILCDDENVSVNDFMNYFAKIFNVKKKIRIPKLIFRIVVGKFVYQTMTMNIKVTNELIKRELGWFPKYKTYKEGLQSLNK